LIKEIQKNKDFKCANDLDESILSLANDSWLNELENPITTVIENSSGNKTVTTYPSTFKYKMFYTFEVEKNQEKKKEKNQEPTFFKKYKMIFIPLMIVGCLLIIGLLFALIHYLLSGRNNRAEPDEFSHQKSYAENDYHFKYIDDYDFKPARPAAYPQNSDAALSNEYE